jgi:ribosome-associated toxin RatA of RatAB toxin-antitoxin module
MAVVHKTVLMQYSAEQMFALVDRVEDYPQFLPWCGGVDVKTRSEENLVATLKINYHGLTQSFTTENSNTPPTGMVMRLVEGPFKQFEARWHFKPLADDACKIEFNMEYEFSNRLLETIIGPVFSMIANSFVDSFCKRAEVVYGN